MDWNNPEEVRAYHRRYYHEKRRQPMIDYLGGECVRCGSTSDLQFDHRIPSEKSFDIRANMTLSNPLVREELDKCQLLCRDCHRSKTGEENSGYTHGTIYAWMKVKCKCDTCTQAKRVWNEDRNAKRRKVGGYGPRGGVAER